jgi:hypothetical protein
MYGAMEQSVIYKRAFSDAKKDFDQLKEPTLPPSDNRTMFVKPANLKKQNTSKRLTEA